MSKKQIIAAGLLLFLILTIVCIITYAPQIEDQLLTLSNYEILEFGVENTEIWFDGRDATVLADLQNKRDLYQAAEIIRNIRGVRSVQIKFVNNHNAIIPAKFSGHKISKSSSENLKFYRLNFSANTTQLDEHHMVMLDTIIARLEARRKYKINIEGFTDNTGSSIENKFLSFWRAKAVKEYFRNRGLDSTRFLVYGRGASQPLTNNATQAGREINRRVEIKLIMED